MATATQQGAKLLNGFKKVMHFDTGLGKKLPEAYRKFWHEWKQMKPAAVHYIPKEGKWERDEVTGRVRPIQDIAIPLVYAPEQNDGIWGGEAVVRGFVKRHPQKRRVPMFWVPVLRRSVVRSDVLNEFMSVTVTERTMNLIHESHGFDHYLLKTPACDLQSTLALKLKQKILKALEAGCPNLADNPEKQKQILKEYKPYLDQYTSEEIDWYGLTYAEAIKKIQKQLTEENPIVPHKVEFRSQLIEQLRNAQIKEAGSGESSDKLPSNIDDTTSSSWLSKMNPFGKKHET